MAYVFSNQQQAKAFIREIGRKYNIAGINGEQTDANNFHTAIIGLLHVVGKDTEAAQMGREITQTVQTDSSSALTAIPETLSAERFGGRVEYDEAPYVRIRIQCPQETFSRFPTITCEGKIPIELSGSNIGVDDFDEDDYQGATLKFLRTTDTVPTGDNTLTITATATDGTRTETTTITITGVSGEGYQFSKSNR